MERWGGVSWSAGFKTVLAGKSQAPLFRTPFVSRPAASSNSRVPLGLSSAGNTCCWSLLPSPMLGAYINTRDALYGHSQQPYTNSDCLEEGPNDLLTGQLIVKGIGSKYWNIQNTATSFGTHHLPSHDSGTFPGHSSWHARSTAPSSAHPGIAQPKVQCFASLH